MDPTAFAIGPDGHAIQRYYYMAQIGWDGRPKEPSLRVQIDNENRPEALDAHNDSFMGEVFMGEVFMGEVFMGEVFMGPWG